MNSVKTKEGGTKHFRFKKQKIKFYRRALRTLKNKHFKTKSAKTRKQRKLNYLVKKLKTLTSRKTKSRRTHRRNDSIQRTRRITSKSMVSPINRDNYISPRIISIHPTQNALTRTPSILRIDDLSTPSSLNIPTVEVSVPANPDGVSPLPQSIHSSMETEIVSPEIANSMSAQTDKSTSSVSLQEDVQAAVPEIAAEATSAIDNISPTPDSLHLSQLGESPQTQNSMSSAKTTMDTA